MNLLEVGKIVRVHGIKGAVKVISYIDEDFSQFKNCYIDGMKAIVKSVSKLNHDACSIMFDIMPDIDTAQKFINKSVFIDRDEYEVFSSKVYLSDLIGVEVKDEFGEHIGEFIDFDNYGASEILTIKCGVVSYQIPFVKEVINYNKELNCFVVDKQKFEDMKI